MTPIQKENPHLIKLGHELNNVWAALLGSAELLQMSLHTDAPEQEFIQMLLDGIDRGEQITQKIRTIAHGNLVHDNKKPQITQNQTTLDSSSVSLANPTLDHDHRHLEQLASQLTDAQTMPDALAMIVEIYQECLHHFHREEQIMQQCPDYPFRDHHHNTHCALLHRLQQIVTKCSDDSLSITDIKDDIQHVTTLLPMHILGMDTGMAPYIAAHPELSQFIYTTPDNATLTAYFHLSSHDIATLT